MFLAPQGRGTGKGSLFQNFTASLTTQPTVQPPPHITIIRVQKTAFMTKSSNLASGVFSIITSTKYWVRQHPFVGSVSCLLLSLELVLLVQIKRGHVYSPSLEFLVMVSECCPPSRSRTNFTNKKERRGGPAETGPPQHQAVVTTSSLRSEEQGSDESFPASH